MKKKPIKNIFILTRDLNFFYQANKSLKALNIPIKILNPQDRIPNMDCLILTTVKEFREMSRMAETEAKFIPYDKSQSFEEYLVKILAFYRVGYKQFSEVTFSIDPGTKKIGLVIILDNYFLHSHTFYEKTLLLEKINQYYSALQNENKNQLFVRFKFGMGVLSLTEMLVGEIFELFKINRNLEVFLVDESKSSKIRIPDKKIRISKHETSALILALRKGIQITRDDYVSIFKAIQTKRIRKKESHSPYIYDFNDLRGEIGNMAKKIITGEQSISTTCKLIENLKESKF